MIFVLEDDASILELILYALKSQNIKATGFTNVADFKSALEKEPLPQLLILDIMLGADNGFNILKTLKGNNKTRNISVLILTALGSEYEKVKGFDLGADDYMTKPFGVMELLARVRAILRRLPQDNEVLEYQGLIFSENSHSVKINNEIIPLTLKEFELLGFLLKNKHRAFNRETLLENLWGYASNAETRTIDAHIKSLRKKLGVWGCHIETIRGVGYKIKTE